MIRVKSLFVCILFSISVCAITHADELKADGIAATVGSDIILLSDVHKQVEITAQRMQATGITQKPTFKDIEVKALQELIDDTLVKQQAAEMKIETTDAEVDAAIMNMAAQNNMDIETFRSALEAQGTTLEQYKETMRSDLLKYKVMNMRVRSRVNISEQKAKEFYNSQVHDVRKAAEFVGAHILIRVPKGARAIEVSALREKAVSLYKQIQAGEDFFELAKIHSEDGVTKPFGGKLGKRMPGEIPSVLDAAFLNMESGEVVGPIKTAAGFHILKLVEREDIGVKSFSDVKHMIIGQLTQKEMERQQAIWLKELRQKTFINIRL